MEKSDVLVAEHHLNSDYRNTSFPNYVGVSSMTFDIRFGEIQKTRYGCIAEVTGPETALKYFGLNEI